MSTDSNLVLVQQLRQGNQRAYSTLISRYSGRLLAYVKRRLHDANASEDVVQETFIGFMNSLPNFDEKRELQGYLFTIAAHKLADYLRKTERDLLRTIADDGESFFENRRDSAAGVSTCLRDQEKKQLERAALAKCLGKLLQEWQSKSEYQRIKVMELLWVKGQPNVQVARFLQIDEQQVANIRYAAVRKLSEYIRDAGLSPDVFPELHADSEET